MTSEVWSCARAAADRVDSGMVVGLGTGRAAAMFVRALAARIDQDSLDIRGVPTSNQTEALAKELGVPLATLDAVDAIDIDVDGADEVDPVLNLIKGHGGALLRERVVAAMSRQFIILVGEEKIVSRLGALRSVPVEVVPFAAPAVERRLKALGASVELRVDDAGPFTSDNGNHILDAHFERIEDPRELERRIDEIPGAVDSGLFVGMADRVLIQSGASHRELTPD